VYSIRNIEVNQERLQWNGHCQLVVYADGFNLLDAKRNTENKGTEALLDAGYGEWSNLQ
jgi:hypothetical protein